MNDDSVHVIAPPRGLSFGFRDLWDHRELGWFLTLRTIKPRFRQTLLGVGWAVVPPVMLMVVFSIFLNRGAGVPSEHGVPYPIFSFSGLLIWQFFVNATTRGGSSLISNAAFLTKVYFPRLLIPFSGVASAVADLGAAFVVLVPLMAYYGVVPTWRLALLPVFVALALLMALAVSLAFAAASVRWRDLSLALPFVVQAWFFATPIAYPLSVFSGGWKSVLLVLNPMAPIVEGFRWAIIDRGAPHLGSLLISCAIILVGLLGGMVFFNRMERTYADEI